MLQSFVQSRIQCGVSEDVLVGYFGDFLDFYESANLGTLEMKNQKLKKKKIRRDCHESTEARIQG
jgi:hypothetical protein